MSKNKHRVNFIAEIGENHMGDMVLAKEMIVEAALAGANIVKFQSYSKDTFRSTDPEYSWFQKVSLSDEDHFLLKKCADENNVEFMSAPFDMNRAIFLCEALDLKRIKVASGKMNDKKLLTYLNENCDEVFLSTGMANLKEIKESLGYLKKVKVNILHCVSQYPLEYKNANLNAIKTLINEFPNQNIGYSDHTCGVLASLVSIILGATIIEKHFTLNKNYKEGTDHILSATPDELKKIIDTTKEISELLGDGVKAPRECEIKIVEFVRNRFVG